MASEFDKNRMIHYDLLRIVAAFSVVMVHCAAQFWYSLPVSDVQWEIANFYDGFFHFPIPIFVMVSGALFLHRDIELKKLYTHNIFRLVMIYLIWSAAYGLFDCRTYDLQETGMWVVVWEMLKGRYHLWFLPMIVSIYMLLPILRSWIRTAEKKNIQYFLLLFVVCKIGVYTLSILKKSEVTAFISDFFNDAEFSMVCSYIGYFVLGYYIVHVGIPKSWHKFIYASVIPAAIVNIVLGSYKSKKAGVPTAELYESYGLFIFVVAVALFLFFTEIMSKVNYSPLAKTVIHEVGKDTLGIYVLHVGVIEFLETKGIHSMTLPIAVGIPALAVGVFVVCLIAAAILRRIPRIGRYIC